MTPSLGVKIARRIAAYEDVAPAALDPPVQAVIDVDALERLVHPGPQTRTDFTGAVSFAYTEYTVTVDHTGAVTVNPHPTRDTDTGSPRKIESAGR